MAFSPQRSDLEKPGCDNHHPLRTCHADPMLSTSEVFFFLSSHRFYKASPHTLVLHVGKAKSKLAGAERLARLARTEQSHRGRPPHCPWRVVAPPHGAPRASVSLNEPCRIHVFLSASPWRGRTGGFHSPIPAALIDAPLKR